ncbi:hypothetical protein BS47DRAFT_1362010 [Hydnum rufescens UP504]|uniref:AMP-dependent synthetase/ligase domain-containing protein n=1 Tax=Hydnum rufescens UP504 TaxID=1448309 RepID=A0A9P6DWS5_9AGAM|nr:hypothetical protein BS47DRAFT_1362010 [Hydnum rufescens UP504]
MIRSSPTSNIKPDNVVDEGALMSSVPTWFPNARLNWAENMLKCRSSTKIALIQEIEPTPPGAHVNSSERSVTYLELYNEVSSLINSLRLMGIQPGDRVASYSSNCIENVVAALASTALGAIWVSAAADFGPDGVLERYKSKVHNHVPKLAEVVSGLEKLSLSPEKVVVISLRTGAQSSRDGWMEDWVDWENIIRQGKAETERDPALSEIQFWRGGFDHPLWILFSSGTTGKPKPIVHRAGGMLLQSAKEFLICGDFVPEDVFFYYTTTGWMMWNFLISALPIGLTIVLFDGSPLDDVSLLFNYVDKLKITLFGTSAKYLEQVATKYHPRQLHSLSSLRLLFSTGSPLAPVQFDWVYKELSPKVLLASITGKYTYTLGRYLNGGTDICSLFAGMNTSLPVYRGEIQCRMLGMSIRAYSEEGLPLAPGLPGDLVCDQHFPCQPLGFWPLPGYGESADAVAKARERYLDSYYRKIEGVWFHGDHVLITPSRGANAGGVIMLGEVMAYCKEACFTHLSSPNALITPVNDTETPEASVLARPKSTKSWRRALGLGMPRRTVGQSIKDGADERVILFIVGSSSTETRFDEAMVKRINAEIRGRRTPRHVPSKIILVQDVPYTLNGKKVEVPVKRLISGAKKESLNLSTIPESGMSRRI